MSRSGYSDDCEYLALYRGAVASSIKGRRGQRLLREMIAALDAMPVKELSAGVFVDPVDGCCALGSVALARGLDTAKLSKQADEPEFIGAAMDIARSMAAEVAHMNDEWPGAETPAERWDRMRAWAVSEITASPGETEPGGPRS